MHVALETVKTYTKNLRAATGKHTTGAAILVLVRHHVI